MLPARDGAEGATMNDPRKTTLFSPAWRTLGLAVAALALLAVHDRPAHAQTAQPVQVAIASEVPWPTVVTVPATVSAVDVAVLASRSGGWVTQVDVDAGVHVAQGAKLIAVGLPAAQAQLAAAEARNSSAEAAYTQAAADQHRFSVLRQTHATSERQYDEAERAYVTAKAERAAAQAALAAAQSDLGYADIRAPFDGIVVNKNVWPGAFVSAGMPLLTIAGATPEVRAYVGPDIYAALRNGATAEVDIDGAAAPATVTRVVSAADPNSRTHLVELHLGPGMTAPYGAFAEVHLSLGQHPQLTIPQAALIERAGLRGVFVVDEHSRAQFRLVRIGAVHGGRVAIVAGLSPGEQVVLTPPASLVGNAPVRAVTRVSGALAKETSRG
jgi:RND family efflux transporter MFP subunit